MSGSGWPDPILPQRVNCLSILEEVNVKAAALGLIVINSKVDSFMTNFRESEGLEFACDLIRAPLLGC